MKKIILFGLLVCGANLNPLATMMNHRTTSASVLQYKQMDYSAKAFSLEIQAWASGMFDPEHTMANLGINGQDYMVLSQDGNGNINPENILLGVAQLTPNYSSMIVLHPELMLYGELFHVYKQFEYVFFDVRTALLTCRTVINIEEIGGGNGGMSDLSATPLYNAYDAFTQSDWQYGKFGQSNKMTGFDNIQVLLGSSTDMQSFSSDDCKSFIAGFALMEIPTGMGTTAEWLFEPQVGTNHWAFGFGGDCMVVASNGFSLLAGGNYRYILKNWETRSFDLTANGQWSRYLALDNFQGLQEQSEGAVSGLPGINVFTQDALIQGRNQVNVYARLKKDFEHCLFELSYNYFHTQKETINEILPISSNYGIYNIASGGGVSTAHLATIAQRDTALDNPPVQLVTSDLNLTSGAAGQWSSSTIAARLQRLEEHCTYGIGGSVDLAHTSQAISTWSVWLNFEGLFPN